MKKACLKLMAKLAEKNIKASRSTTCFALSYQPKAPVGIRNFKK